MNIERIQNQLYPGDKTYDGDEGNLPGFKALQLILKAKSSELNRSEWMTALDCNLKGIGSFSVVISVPNEEGYVIKMSKVGRTDFLRNEAAALSILSRDDKENEKDPDGRAFLLKLVTHGYHALPIGKAGGHFKMPSLTISPKAKSLAHFLNKKKEPSEKLGILIKIFLDYAYALHFMHERDLGHLDVSTTNMLVREEDGFPRGLLVDFSASRKLKEPIKGFVGNVLFAHSDVHRDAAWYADVFHDFAALGFALAALCADILDNGHPIWRAAGVGSCKDGEGAEERRKSAKSFIDDYFGSYHDCLLCDRTKTRLRLYCRSKGLAVKESNSPVELFQELANSWVEQDEESVFTECPSYKLKSVGGKVQPLRDTDEYKNVVFDKSDQGRSLDLKTRTI
jgi:hypothetical protein